LPGEIGLLPYTTSKEEIIETSNEDETQVDSGNRQVDSSGNQDQAIDQEKLNSQDDDVIGPQAPSTQAPSAQASSVQAPPAQAPSAQAPPAQVQSIQALSVQAPPIQAPPTQAPSVQAPPTQAPPAQAPSTQAPSTQAPPVQAPSAQAPPQAPSAQALPAQAPSAQAPSAQATSAQATSAQAPLASPFSLTKAKEPRQPSLSKPPQPAQQLLPTATASTLPPLHMDQPTYDPCLPQNELHKAKPIAKEPVVWEKEHPSQGTYTTSFTDRRYRQQYQNPPPIPPFRPPISRKAV